MYKHLILLMGIMIIAGLAMAEPSAEDIVEKLKPSPVMRSLRGISVENTEERSPPSIDLEVNFEFNSAKLTNDAQITLRRLGKALRDERLAPYSFVIAGHTDAVGGDVYNQQLSERRAQSVAYYLQQNYGISASRLSIKGFGESQLLDPYNPEASVNRRVQVTNVGISASR